MLDVALLPCPFCGSPPDTDTGENGEGTDWFTIGCEDGCVTMHGGVIEELCREWNLRDGKLSIEPMTPEQVVKTRMAYHSTYIAVEMFAEIRELANWMEGVMKPEKDGEHENGYAGDRDSLEGLESKLKTLGWKREK